MLINNEDILQLHNRDHHILDNFSPKVVLPGFLTIEQSSIQPNVKRGMIQSISSPRQLKKSGQSK
jgi:hypothetical protein